MYKKPKTLLDKYYWPIICVLSIIILIGGIAFFSVVNPSKPLPDAIPSNTVQQNIRVNNIPISISLKPDTHIYYVMLKPANISGNFKVYTHLISEDSFDFYIFENKDDFKNSSAKPIKTFLLIKNLNRTFPVEEGNVMVLLNSRDKDVNVEGFVEYLEEKQ